MLWYAHLALYSKKLRITFFQNLAREQWKSGHP